MNTIDALSGLKKIKGFKIIHLNCRSIFNQRDEIKYQYDEIDFLVNY